jgi:hypothetical protein
LPQRSETKSSAACSPLIAWGSEGKQRRKAVHTDNDLKGLRLPNTLHVSPSHTRLMVAHFLRGLYANAPKEKFPLHLQELVDELETNAREEVHASSR